MESLCKLICFLFLGSLLLSCLRAFAQAGASAWNDLPSDILLDCTPPSFMSPLRCTFSEQPFSSPASPPPYGCNPWLDRTFMLYLSCLSPTYTWMYEPWNLVVVFFFCFLLTVWGMSFIFHHFFKLLSLKCTWFTILCVVSGVSAVTYFVFADYTPL